MQYGLTDILTLIGALGFFIYGMKIMSEGIQKAAGKRLRAILSAMTKNRFFGVLTGFLITSLVQSSSATTVMTVSFVNAGLLSLVESAGVMMGANIGTTITGWLVSYFGFKFKIVTISLPIIAIGMPLMFTKNSTMKSWGEFLIGFALLFMGLNELKDAVPNLKENPELLSFLANYTNLGILTTLLFVGVGALLTIIIQSSSAAMTLTFVMCFNGWIPFEVAACMVLGENIGTTITAELASLVGNVHAKRSARVHSLFNVVGVTWMIFVLPYYLELVTWFSTEIMGNNSPYVDSESVPFALSYFHTAFNLSNVLLLIGFVPYLVRIAERSVPSKGDMDEVFHLEYIGSGLMSAPELSVIEAGKEVAKFGKLTKKLAGFVPKLLIETDRKQLNLLYDRIRKYEEITDRMEAEIADYLGKASTGKLSEASSLKIRSMLSIISDLERIADICYQMSKVVERKNSKKIWFSPEQRQNLLDMFKIAEKSLEHMVEVLENSTEEDFLEKAQEIERQINKMRNRLRKEHLVNTEKGEYSFQSGIIYNDLFSSIEKIGDHVINVSEAMAEEVE
jgi:phosphate:Na+ symporter